MCALTQDLSTNSLQVDVHGNGVYENSEHGMVVRGRGDINFNDVFCNRKAALNFAQKSHFKVGLRKPTSGLPDCLRHCE